MIAITAYTELIPSEAIIHEPLQEQKSEENEEHSSFAQLLAGLLQNSQSMDLSDTESGLNALAVEEAADGNKLNLFANAMGNRLSLEDFSDIDLSDAAIENVYRLFDEQAEGSEKSVNFDISDSLKEVDAKTLESLAGLAAKMDSADTDSSSRIAAEAAALFNSNAKQNVKEQPSADAVIDKNEKIETLFAKNQTGEKDNESLGIKRDLESSGILDEMRRGLKKNKASLEVRDMRTDSALSADRAALQNQAFALAESAAGRVPGQASIQEVMLELRLPDHGQNSQAQTSWEAKASSAMESMLARELHQNFNGDIVRHASMILRNGGEGIIRLALYPETLGNVKIHLEMAENKITGLIVVESEEALKAFRKEIAALEQAFKDAGYEDASLNLELTADGAGAEHQELDESSYAAQMAAFGYEESLRDSADQETAPVINVLFGQRAGSINMLA